MTKFGTNLIVHPLSTEQVHAQMMIRRYGEVKDTIDISSVSVKVEDTTQPLAECIKAIKHLEAKNSEYAIIEFYTDEKGISRLNVLHAK